MLLRLLLLSLYWLLNHCMIHKFCLHLRNTLSAILWLLAFSMSHPPVEPCRYLLFRILHLIGLGPLDLQGEWELYRRLALQSQLSWSWHQVVSHLRNCRPKFGPRFGYQASFWHAHTLDRVYWAYLCLRWCLLLSRYWILRHSNRQ